MQNNLNTLIEHKNVLSVAAHVISGALEGADDAGNNRDEE